MTSERINIGTYPKAKAFKIRDSVRKFAKLRGQRIKIELKGRGKKEEGFRDGNTKASDLAIYLEVYGNDDILTPFRREKMEIKVASLVRKVRGDMVDDLLLNGFKGYRNYSDMDLIDELLEVA